MTLTAKFVTFMWFFFFCNLFLKLSCWRKILIELVQIESSHKAKCIFFCGEFCYGKMFLNQNELKVKILQLCQKAGNILLHKLILRVGADIALPEVRDFSGREDHKMWLKILCLHLKNKRLGLDFGAVVLFLERIPGNDKAGRKIGVWVLVTRFCWQNEEIDTVQPCGIRGRRLEERNENCAGAPVPAATTTLFTSSFSLWLAASRGFYGFGTGRIGRKEKCIIKFYNWLMPCALC